MTAHHRAEQSTALGLPVALIATETSGTPEGDHAEHPRNAPAQPTLPSRAHPDDAGLDLVSACDVVIEPGSRALVSTGIAVALPPGTVGMVCPRSGLAAKHGVTVLNGPGIVDAGYRGEIKVALINTDQRASFAIRAGDRIAQLVILPVVPTTPRLVSQLPQAARGDHGFGSSGGFQTPAGQA
ncbi:dUTP diphosphatase [Devriesea agamarum]|uniref:dUTP diphosphatase n=1 Tax=Devriesea agamarum TaxID=472569 RepID=UPI000A005076